MCGDCITYLRLSFLKLSNGLIHLSDEKECKELLARLYIGLCYKIQIHRLGQNINILTRSDYPSEWTTCELSKDKFTAVNNDTSQKIDMVLDNCIPISITYSYFSDLIRLELNGMRPHGKYFLQQGNNRLNGWYKWGMRDGKWEYISGNYKNVCHYENDMKCGMSVTHYQGRRTDEEWKDGKLNGYRSVYCGDKLIEKKMYNNDRFIQRIK